MSSSLSSVVSMYRNVWRAAGRIPNENFREYFQRRAREEFRSHLQLVNESAATPSTASSSTFLAGTFPPSPSAPASTAAELTAASASFMTKMEKHLDMLQKHVTLANMYGNPTVKATR
eukprot:GHVT01010898.1.p1 GENE.GHVT01010898.1~~GHVT01010898.1.p1  ORF type:complete len:118 (-),score=24.92 GHVT01010898.1:497-850(-)